MKKDLSISVIFILVLLTSSNYFKPENDILPKSCSKISNYYNTSNQEYGIITDKFLIA